MKTKSSNEISTKVYLVGMPGSGKSTFGRLIAQKLSFNFVDSDEIIEQNEEMTVAEIFSQKGETYFRQQERKVILSLLGDCVIIATGGGVPCYHGNMEFIKNNGLSIFLDTPLEIIAQRVLQQKGKRPLLPSREETALLNQLREKYQQRLPFYEQADLHLKEPSPDPEKVTRIIREKLSL